MTLMRRLLYVAALSFTLSQGPDAGAVMFAAATPTRSSAQPAATAVDRYLAWLSDPSRMWLATAHLQQMPELAIPRLLEPGRLLPGPHGELSAASLALAKIGAPALPAIGERLRLLVRDEAATASAETATLIDVLRAIGPPAVGALVQAAESNPRWAPTALDAIVRMEPTTTIYGQTRSPWLTWSVVADDRFADLDRAIVPLLPRIEKSLHRALVVPESNPPHVLRAAYLLARWGNPSQRAVALPVLEDLARPPSFHASLSVIRTMHSLKAPGTAAAIRSAAPRVPSGDELRGAYLLSMGIALHQLGERDYGVLVGEAIRSGRPVDRMDAAQFLGRTENLEDVPRLIALLADETLWNGRPVRQAAVDALRLLTLQDLPAEPEAWRAWYSSLRGRSRRVLVEQWIAARRKQLDEATMWEANRWIEQLAGTRDGAVLPLVADYLRRKDLKWNATGPTSGIGGSGPAPGGRMAPPVVTLLLGMVQAGVPGAVAGLEWCLDALDAEVRMFGAVALAAYDRQRAGDVLAREMATDEAAHRQMAAEFLLHLGDARGTLPRIEALELGARLYKSDVSSTQDQEWTRGMRMFACRDLRLFSQQPLPCDPRAGDESLGTQVAAWRTWAASAARRLPLRQAHLDREAMYRVRAVTIGEHIAH